LPGKGIDEKTRANIREMVSTMENGKNSAASPTEEKPAIDWLLILPSAYSEESTVDMAMYLESEFPPPLIEKEGKNYRLKSWTGGDSGKGTARYAYEYKAREGEVYRKWSDLKKATNKEVDAQIEIWKEEFGAALDEAIGDGEGISSMVLPASERGYRTASHYLNHYRDEGEQEYLNWEVINTVSDKVGIRYVTVWKNSHRDSDPARSWGWEVRVGSQGLGMSGGVGFERLTGYAKTINIAKTDGMKALLGANQVDELRKAEEKAMKDMISQPMMKKDTDDS
jgi:hypothetical protein